VRYGFPLMRNDWEKRYGMIFQLCEDFCASFYILKKFHHETITQCLEGMVTVSCQFYESWIRGGTGCILGPSIEMDI